MKIIFSKVFLIISTLEGLLSFIWLFAKPSMERNALLWGFSASRLLLGVLVFGIIVILLLTTLRAFLRPASLKHACQRLDEKISERIVFNLILAIFLTGLLYGIGLYYIYAAPNINPPFNLSIFRSINERLLPVIVWSWIEALQIIIFLCAIVYSNRLPKDDKLPQYGNALNKSEIIILVMMMGLAIFVAYLGWKLFWFMTDDAHIAFRYVSNSILGYGYVWNPQPFRPVEGYTSFLWVALLDGIWRITGAEPPDVANNISLLFSQATLLLGAWLFLRIPWHAKLKQYRIPLLGITLIGLLLNRTFLAWTSSGLETAMFNFFLTLWICCCLLLPVYSRLWILGISLSASLAYLTRPDGMLLVAVSICLFGLMLFTKQKARIIKYPDFLAALPLLAFPAHMLWRHAFYGEWLPNTYYAKTITGWFWVLQGLEYLLSFIIEYALWMWVLVLIILAIRSIKRGLPPLKTQMEGKQLTTWAVLITIVGHIGYYTLRIGGDHFEYRVFSYLILLFFITFVWMLNELRVRAISSGILIMIFVLFSLPIPWTHWHQSQSLTTREQTYIMKVSVADAYPNVPVLLQQYLQYYDRLQFDLISHFNCMRHQEHKIFTLFMKESLPSREQGFQIPAEGYPVLKYYSVGVTSWMLPRINIIDGFGLNDYVIARNPDLNPEQSMAHERKAPKGYYNCFMPNVKITGRDVIIQPRSSELTAEKIKDCEQKFAQMMEEIK